MRFIGLAAVFALIGCAAQADAAEYFVSKMGSDESDGLSEATAFATIGKGISVLAAGDTLTILPGEYFESISTRISGKPDSPITIRAKRPGTVLMRGDIDAAGFQLLPGTRYTYMKAIDRYVEGVGERDSFKMYAFVPSIEEVEDVRASCYYDNNSQILYVHSSDSTSPDGHALSVSVTNGFGIIIEPLQGEKTVHDVVIDGLAFSGYLSREIAPRPGSNTRWGLYIVEAERCIVRRCTAFLNGGGIGLVRPADCLVEDCLAFGNYSTFNSSGGNIICWSPATNTIQRNNVAHTSKSNGIRFYGDGTTNCLQEGNLIYDCDYGELWIKGGKNATSRMIGNISLGALHNSGGVAAGNIRNNICRYGTDMNDDGSNIIYASIRAFDMDRNFADPVHHDYRLQSDSPLRGTGPDGSDPGPFPYRDEVFFVSPDGDDNASGTSVRQAWQTLAKAAASVQPGQTVYVLGGCYGESLRPANSGEPDKPITFRRRGRELAVLDGAGEIPVGVDLAGRSNVIVEGLAIRSFTEQGIRASDGGNVRIEKCQLLRNGTGILASRVKTLYVSHCLLRDNGKSGLKLQECPDAEVTGNIIDANGSAGIALDKATAASLWSDRNNLVPGDDVTCASVDGKDFADPEGWREFSNLDANSLSVKPDYVDAESGNFSLQVGSLLAGRGPLATPIGPYERDEIPVPLTIERVEVCSATSTTANIQWWTPTAEATTTLEWGTTPDCENRIEDIRDNTTFHTASLIGLERGAKYYFRVSSTIPGQEFHFNTHLFPMKDEKTVEISQTKTLDFATLTQGPPPREFHVAVTGNDSNDGLSTETAWRTLRHAAAFVKAGDTVTIHGGTYEEYARVLGTGDADAPIIFRAAPGEKVWLDGSEQKRPCAIRIAYKHYVNLDGLYLHNFRASRYQTSAEAGAIEIVGGGNNTVRRCFYDGRSEIYMPYFMHARDSENILVENCVIIQGWNGVDFHTCPNIVLRNCVFYNCLIRAITLYNEADQPATLTHNIICDNIPQKYRNPLTGLWHVESLRADHNCYFVRKPPTERHVVDYIRIKGEKNAGKLLMSEFRELTGQGEGSIFANPGMPVVKEMPLEYEKDLDWQLIEMHRKGDEIYPLDFADFFADPAGPCGMADDGIPIGLAVRGRFFHAATPKLLSCKGL